jgi:hypothetical protein
MRLHVPFVVSFLDVVFLCIIILAHGATKSPSYDSRTQYFIHGYNVNKPMLRIYRIPDRHRNQWSLGRNEGIISPTIRRHHQNNAAAVATTTHLNMCICINCARVINCSAYYFVETKHEQPHIAAEPTFTPRDGSPTIHVNIRTNDRLSSIQTATGDRSTGNSLDKNYRIWSEERKLAQSEKLLTGEAGETIIPISTTYTEYDVVACADYVEDMNCWVRNMPDEIKRANPNFVPT